MSNFKHAPFTQDWYLALNDNGEHFTDDYYASQRPWYAEEDIDDLDVGYELTVYESATEWIPVRRIRWDGEEFQSQQLPPASSKVQRLQAAVREMLESLNALEYSHYNTRKTLDSYKPSTIETYGLRQKDMK